MAKDKPGFDPKTFKLPPKRPAPEGGESGKKPPGGELAASLPEEPVQPPEAKAIGNPFRRHSLRGDGAKLEAQATDTRPLLGDFVMHGQSTMIYAEPNAGKTLTVLRLIIDAIDAAGIDPNHVFYVNADDSSRGLAEKVRLLEEVGAHMLAPGFKGFRANDFSDKLKQAAEDGSARGTVVIIDTLKKFTNLMDKARSAEFAQLSRAYVMGGGTVVGLGHTAKNKNPDGTPRYEGTTDIRDGFDAVYVAELMKAKPGSNERMIRFSQNKSRADSPEIVAYAYSTEKGLSYREKLASVRLVYPEELDGHTVEDERFDEKSLISEIRFYIDRFPNNGQEKLVKAISNGGDYSRATVRRVLDRHTGADPSKHLWNYRKGDRGVRNYHLLTPD